MPLLLLIALVVGDYRVYQISRRKAARPFPTAVFLAVNAALLVLLVLWGGKKLLGQAFMAAALAVIARNIYGVCKKRLLRGGPSPFYGVAAFFLSLSFLMLKGPEGFFWAAVLALFFEVGVVMLTRFAFNLYLKT